jgi:hypothetical protein
VSVSARGPPPRISEGVVVGTRYIHPVTETIDMRAVEAAWMGEVKQGRV